MGDPFKALKNHILRTGLLPVIALSLVLGTLSTLLAISQTNTDYEQQTQTTAEQIALLTRTALRHGDQDLLKEFTRLSLQQKGLHGLKIHNSAGQLLYQAGPPFQVSDWPQTAVQRPTLTKQNGSMLYTLNLISDTDPAQELWLELEFNNEAVQLARYQWTLLGVTTSALTLLLATVISLRLANSIVSPLNQLTANLDRISLKNINSQVPSPDNKALSPLTSRINALLHRMQHSYRKIKGEMNVTKQELQNNMETLEINNAELDLSRKRALAASKAKSDFLANMSHEMRTPLNSISGYAGLLSRSNLNQSQQEHLRTLSTSADSLLAIIDDILDFAKLEAGKLVLEKSPVRLRTLIDEVLAMNSLAAQAKGLELAALFDSDVPSRLHIDPNRLKQVVTNLVSNAIKFTRQGSVIVRVSCEQRWEQQVRVMIAVEDTGIGISAGDARKLFQAFSQVNTSRSRNTTGTGLGLVICKNLVEQMQGEIDFDSSPGQGSRFWFTLQARLESDTTPPPEAKGQCLMLAPKSWTATAVAQLLPLEGYNVELLDNTSQLGQLLNNLKLLHSDQSPTLVVVEAGHDTLPFIEQLPQQSGDSARGIILSGTSSGTLLQHLQSRTLAVLSSPVTEVRLRETLQQLYTPEDGTRTSSAKAADTTTVKHRGRILAVDDNQPNLKLLDIMLSDTGVNVDTASGGYQALTLIKKHDYDLVFMDIQMPDMDGLEVTRRIRDHEPEGSRLPVIALTAHALDNEKQQLLKAGMDDYLTKPVSDQQLRHILDRWLNRAPEQSGYTASSPQMPQYSRSPAAVRQPVDFEAGIRLAGGRKQLARELLAMLLDSLDSTREECQQLLQQRQWQALQEAVHKLHGATRYCGVPLLQQACQELETLLKQGTAASTMPEQPVQQAMDNLLQEMARLQTWRARFMAEAPA